GKQLVTAGADGTARVWELATGKPVTPLLRHGAGVLQAAFSPDGRRVATGSADRTARVWDAAPGKPVTPPLEHRAAVTLVAFSPDGRRVATAAADRVRQWDAAAGDALGPSVLAASAGRVVNHVGFTPDGRLVTASGVPGDPRARQTWELSADARSVPD